MEQKTAANDEIRAFHKAVTDHCIHVAGEASQREEKIKELERRLQAADDEVARLRDSLNVLECQSVPEPCDWPGCDRKATAQSVGFCEKHVWHPPKPNADVVARFEGLPCRCLFRTEGAPMDTTLVSLDDVLAIARTLSTPAPLTVESATRFLADHGLATRDMFGPSVEELQSTISDLSQQNANLQKLHAEASNGDLDVSVRGQMEQELREALGITGMSWESMLKRVRTFIPEPCDGPGCDQHATVEVAGGESEKIRNKAEYARELERARKAAHYSGKQSNPDVMNRLREFFDLGDANLLDVNFLANEVAAFAAYWASDQVSIALYAKGCDGCQSAQLPALVPSAKTLLQAEHVDRIARGLKVCSCNEGASCSFEFVRSLARDLLAQAGRKETP